MRTTTWFIADRAAEPCIDEGLRRARMWVIETIWLGTLTSKRTLRMGNEGLEIGENTRSLLGESRIGNSKAVNRELMIEGDIERLI